MTASWPSWLGSPVSGGAMLRSSSAIARAVLRLSTGWDLSKHGYS